MVRDRTMSMFLDLLPFFAIEPLINRFDLLNVNNLIIFLVYVVSVYLNLKFLFINNQSIGGKIFGLKLVLSSNNKKLIIFARLILYYVIYLLMYRMLAYVNLQADYIPFFSMIFLVLVSMIVMLLDKHERTLADLLLGTLVKKIT